MVLLEKMPAKCNAFAEIVLPGVDLGLQRLVVVLEGKREGEGAIK